MKIIFTALLWASIITMFVTQLIVPFIKGTRIFPMFRKERRKLEEEITELKEKIEINALKKQAEQLREKAEPKAEETK